MTKHLLLARQPADHYVNLEFYINLVQTRSCTFSPSGVLVPVIFLSSCIIIYTE